MTRRFIFLAFLPQSLSALRVAMAEDKPRALLQAQEGHGARASHFAGWFLWCLSRDGGAIRSLLNEVKRLFVVINPVGYFQFNLKDTIGIRLADHKLNAAIFGAGDVALGCGFLGKLNALHEGECHGVSPVWLRCLNNITVTRNVKRYFENVGEAA